MTWYYLKNTNFNLVIIKQEIFPRYDYDLLRLFYCNNFSLRWKQGTVNFYECVFKSNRKIWVRTISPQKGISTSLETLYPKQNKQKQT